MLLLFFIPFHKDRAMTTKKTLPRTETTFIKKHAFVDIEQTLINHFGDEFAAYRRKYHHSMNYDSHGDHSAFPLTVSFELINRCNLNCIMCYTDHHKKTKFTLNIEKLNEILKECEANNLPAAVIGMGAEALLYKDIKNVIKSTRDHGVMDVFLGTNGTLLSSDISRFIIEQEISRLEISLDATTPETYEKIRGKNQLDLIEANIHEFLRIRKEMGKTVPLLRLCFCVQKENYHEVEAFKKKWDNSGVDYLDFQNVVDFSDVGPALDNDDTWSPPTVEDLAAQEDTHCAYPFNSLHVWANGDITPCCTYYGQALSLGSVNDLTLTEAWNGEKITDLRKQLKGEKELNPICRSCLFKRDAESFSEV